MKKIKILNFFVFFNVFFSIVQKKFLHIFYPIPCPANCGWAWLTVSSQTQPLNEARKRLSSSTTNTVGVHALYYYTPVVLFRNKRKSDCSLRQIWPGKGHVGVFEAILTLWGPVGPLWAAFGAILTHFNSC